MRTSIIFLSVVVVGALLPGCSTPQRTTEPGQTLSQADVRVDFTDPVLNNRQILLFGAIDQRAAELTIQKLLYLLQDMHVVMLVHVPLLLTPVHQQLYILLWTQLQQALVLLEEYFYLR